MYELLYAPPEEVYEGSVPRNVLEGIKRKLQHIAAEAESFPHQRLRWEHSGLCKLKWGQYRAIYQVDHDARIIRVVRIGPRRDVYD